MLLIFSFKVSISDTFICNFSTQSFNYLFFVPALKFPIVWLPERLWKYVVNITCLLVFLLVATFCLLYFLIFKKIFLCYFFLLSYFFLISVFLWLLLCVYFMLTLVCLFIYFSKVNLLVLSCDTCDALLFNIKLTYYFLFNFVMICQFVFVINCVFHSVHVCYY